MTPTPLAAAVDLPLGLEAAGLARRTVAQLLRGWHVDDDAWTDDVLLVTSELVTNAVRHGGHRVRLDLQLDADHLRVAVSDGSSVLPAQRADEQDESGRGLAIIAALAASWGVEARADGGKTVWVRLAVPVAATPAPFLDGDAAPA